jgi:hypothetical protein
LDDQPAYRLQLLTILLKQRNKSDHAEVVELTRQLQSLPDWKTKTIRALLLSNLEFNELDSAWNLSHELIISEEANQNDLLRHLQILLRTRPELVSAFLKKFRTPLVETPLDISKICGFLSSKGKASTALAWLESIPLSTENEFYHRLAKINVLLELEKWEETKSLIGDEAWDANEPIRQAFLARLAQEQGKLTQAQFHWKKAVRMALSSAETTVMLAESVKRWPRWENYSVEIFEEIFKRRIHIEYAYAELRRIYRLREQPERMLDLTSNMLKLNPDNPNLRNDRVMYSLLLDKQVSEAYREAKQLHDQYPESFLVKTTYAFSLYHQGQFTEALGVMESLDRRALRLPELAFYQALFLKASGKKKEAEEYFTASRGARLMKIEQDLWERL